MAVSSPRRQWEGQGKALSEQLQCATAMQSMQSRYQDRSADRAAPALEKGGEGSRKGGGRVKERRWKRPRKGGGNGQEKAMKGQRKTVKRSWEGVQGQGKALEAQEQAVTSPSGPGTRSTAVLQTELSEKSAASTGADCTYLWRTARTGTVFPFFI